MAPRNRHLPTARTLTLGIFVLGLALCAAGCNAPLLSPEEPRSPFDRYDAVRNQRAEQYIFDDYGIRRPDLKGRLSPRD